MNTVTYNLGTKVLQLSGMEAGGIRKFSDPYIEPESPSQYLGRQELGVEDQSEVRQELGWDNQELGKLKRVQGREARQTICEVTSS